VKLPRIVDTVASAVVQSVIVPRTIPNRLTNRVFRRVFAGYAILCVFIIFGQLAWEYTSAVHNVARDLRSLGQSFVPGVTDALWNYQDALLRATVAGIRENPVVTGVAIEKKDGTVVASGGRHPSPASSAYRQFFSLYQRYEAPLEYTVGERTSTIGRLVIVSDNTVVERRLADSFQTSLTIAVVNAGLLWLLFYAVINLTVSRPLSGLASQVEAFDAQGANMRPLVYPDNDEIGSLVAAFNRLLAGLSVSHREMEATVKERTRELRELAAELQILSNRDALTGCFNRRYMNERLENEVARAVRHGAPLSLVMCDIDHFKSINDNDGHAIGDLVLCDFARSLMDGIRRDIDWVVRFGGEEFLVVLPETRADEAIPAIERLRLAFAAREVRTDRRAFHVTVSFGVVSTDTWEGSPPDVLNLLAAADRALYRAKAEGRNRVVVHEPV